ncbi:hypothetical protein VP14_097 [Vibrio phage VPMCC14]|nr:hypothetical protein VP14_097 [Vibrio phage VPMCC14]
MKLKRRNNMIEQENNTQMTIIPKSDEAREAFYNRINEWIKLQYVIESAQESQKDIMDMIAESHVDSNPDTKKTDVKKRAKLLIDEFLKAKATTEAQLIDDVLGDYSIASKFLKG